MGGATPAPTPAPAPTPGVEEEHIVEGQVDLAVENATAACADQSLSDAVLKAQAKLADVPETAVEVTCVENSQRRLGSNSRRLAAESVSFKYKIAVPSAADAKDVADQIDSMSVQDMAGKIQDELPANSTLKVQVTGKSASAVVVTITTTTTANAGEEPDDSHARNPAALGSVAMAVIAATLAWPQ